MPYIKQTRFVRMFFEAQHVDKAVQALIENDYYPVSRPEDSYIEHGWHVRMYMTSDVHRLVFYCVEFMDCGWLAKFEVER